MKMVRIRITNYNYGMLKMVKISNLVRIHDKLV